MLLLNRRTNIYREVFTEREKNILLQMGIYDIVEVVDDTEETKEIQETPKKRGRKPKPKLKKE